MDSIPKPIQQILNDYVEKISKQIPIKKVIVFGSYAKDSFRSDSDIDIAVFSDYFNTMSRVDGIMYLLMEASDYDIDIEPQAFTVYDYNNPLGIVEEIIKTGVELPN
ncbi:MAG: nucleotidyltransferase domain-containing protein [Clostridiales bacterium]|nr:nucleotidyltransferase domain-containing protein [Clostridiales bacterium]